MDDDSYVVAAKGALEGILAHSRLYESTRSAAVEANRRLAAQGLRVLALAVKRMDQLGVDRDADERDPTVYGLLGFQDPLRSEVPGAVAECQHAGIRITMISSARTTYRRARSASASSPARRMALVACRTESVVQMPRTPAARSA